MKTYYYKLKIAYDGTNYCGWQLQKNALSIQEVMMKAAESFVKTEVTITGCSRTDSGVHAMGYIVLFTCTRRFEPKQLIAAFNKFLPRDVVVHHIEEVDDSFHPRYTTNSKHYRYTIYNNEYSLPQYNKYSYYYRKPFDVNAMKEGVKYLVGEHDFKSFSSFKTTVDNTVREIYNMSIVVEDIQLGGRYIHIDVTGNGFLYNMVRIMAGTLMEIGLGKKNPESIQEIIKSKDRHCAGPTAPACGLTLMGINYRGENG